MAILAIDTSMAACSAAILPSGTTRPVQQFACMTRGHAEALFPMIEAVMSEAGIDFTGLEKIAVTLGPGSFTGVRVGLAAARGLALAAKRPVIAATSLEVMAQGCVRVVPPSERASGFAVIHDARRDEFYMQCFDAGGEALSKPAIVSVQQAIANLPHAVTLIAGSGAAAVAAEAERAGRVLRAALPELLPEAADLARIAIARPECAHSPAPLYLRPPDAKPQMDKSLVRMDKSLARCE